MNGVESAGFLAAVSVAFMQGFVGSLHCIGMCGPFVHLLNGRSAKPASSEDKDEALQTADSSRAPEEGSRTDGTSSQEEASPSHGSPGSGDSGTGSARFSISRASANSGSVAVQEKPRRIDPITYRPKNPGNRWNINLVYNLMRSLSYMSVGFLLGMAGKTINLYVVNSIAAVLGAVLLLYFGLSFLFPTSIPGFHGIRMPGWFNRSIGQLLRGRTNPVENAALMGMVSGLLPCGLLYPAYGLALSTGEPLAGAFIMFVFSLGTYPALMFLGLASSKLWDFLRAKWPGRILGLAMILYAVFIVFKRWSHAGQF